MLVIDFYFIWWLLKEPFCVSVDARVFFSGYSSSELELIQNKLILSMNEKLSRIRARKNHSSEIL